MVKLLVTNQMTPMEKSLKIISLFHYLLLSYGVCKDAGSIIKNINQQLQPSIIKTLLETPNVVNNKKII